MVSDQKPTPDEVLAKWDEMYPRGVSAAFYSHEVAEALRTALEQTREAIRQRGEARLELSTKTSPAIAHWHADVTARLAEVTRERDEYEALFEVWKRDALAFAKERDEARAALDRALAICVRAEHGNDSCVWVDAIAEALGGGWDAGGGGA